MPVFHSRSAYCSFSLLPSMCQCLTNSACMTLYTTLFSLRPDADGDCTCKLTSCKATYFAMDEREAPAKCSRRNRCAGLSGDDLESCLKKWGNCVKKEFKKQYGKVCIMILFYVILICMDLII